MVDGGNIKQRFVLACFWWCCLRTVLVLTRPFGHYKISACEQMRGKTQTHLNLTINRSSLRQNRLFASALPGNLTTCCRRHCKLLSCWTWPKPQGHARNLHSLWAQIHYLPFNGFKCLPGSVRVWACECTLERGNEKWYPTGLGKNVAVEWPVEWDVDLMTRMSHDLYTRNTHRKREDASL